MAKTKILKWGLIAIAGVVVLGLIDRACLSSARLERAKADYAELKRIAAADKEISDGVIGHMTEIIGQKDEEIAGLKAAKAQTAAKLATVSGELAELRANEPSQPELEGEPLVVNLRAQIAKLTEAFDLSQNTVAIQAQEIEAWKVKFDAAMTIGKEWKAQYDREHILRLASEGLFKISEHRLKVNGLWGKAKTAIIVGAAAYIAVREVAK